ncbi:hypothetical protein TWF696_008862 [Orbilia brochopaga]|uniref:Uncharacterized protein n=1 Tax=Orbilia brochopaga TaxID=3140254 RepID=A0AAV9UEE9_9PEZI
MPHAARILRSSSALFFIRFLSVADAYYIASVRSSPTQPQGRPQWGWLPLAPVIPGAPPPCHVAGSEELGWLQAIGVINQAAPPPGLFPGNTEGFIFYDGPDCRKELSQKMLYIKFDPTSPNPQVANLRNLDWSADPENQMNLADNKYWSFREVYSQADDKDVPAIPLEIDLPDAFVYPMEAYIDNEGNQEWIGEVLPDSVTTIEIPDAGPMNDPSLLAFDSLVSLMSALGQDIATQQQLMQYTADDFPGSRGFAGERLARLGTQQGSPSRMLNVGTQSMQPSLLWVPAQGGGLQMAVETNANQQTPEQDDIQNEIRLFLAGQDRMGPAVDAGDFRGRSRHPFYSPPETPEEAISDTDLTELQLSLENPSDIPSDQFDPIRLSAEIQSRWAGLVRDNGDLLQMADWNDIGQGMLELVSEGIRLLRNGQEWIDNLVGTTDRLVGAQQSLLAAVDDAVARREQLEVQYQAAIDEIEAMTEEARNAIIPTADQTAIVEQAPAMADAAVQEFNTRVAPIDFEIRTYASSMNENERDFSGYILRLFAHLQRIEIRLREIRQELDLDDVVEIVGLPANQQNEGEGPRTPTDVNDGGMGGV